MFTKIKRLALTGAIALAMLFGIIVNDVGSTPPTTNNSAAIVVSEQATDTTTTTSDIIKGNINVGTPPFVDPGNNGN